MRNANDLKRSESDSNTETAWKEKSRNGMISIGLTSLLELMKRTTVAQLKTRLSATKFSQDQVVTQTSKGRIHIGRKVPATKAVA